MISKLLKGRYEVQGLLGEGCYGKVYRAFDTKTIQYVAIKVIDPVIFYKLSQYSEHEKLKALLSRDHSAKKYINEMIDHFEEGPMHVIVLELLHCDLLQALLKFPFVFRLDMIAMVGYSLCKALKSFQNVNLEGLGKTALIHGDLKLDNVMFTSVDYDSVKIIDFGLAHFQAERKLDFAQNVYFKAPEGFFHTKAAPTPAVDMWSVGMILFDLFTKSHLFKEVDTEEEQIANLVYAFKEPSSKMMKNDPKLDILFDKIGNRLKLKPFFAAKCTQRTTFTEMFSRAASVQSYKDPEMAPWVEKFCDLLVGMLEFDPKLRLKPREALKSPFFGLLKKNNRCRSLYENLICVI